MAAFKCLAAAACLALALAGCKPGAAITCPTLKVYSESFKAAASAELDMIEAKAPHIVQMINDYGVERDAIRKCLKLRKKSRE